MDEQTTLALLMFAEAYKGKDFSTVKSDAPAVAYTAVNRSTALGIPIDEVVKQKGQYFGYNSPEWKRAQKGNLTGLDKERYDMFKSLAGGILDGGYNDPTGGATHMYNAERDPNNSWGQLQTPNSVAPWEEYYPVTYDSGPEGHTFHKPAINNLTPDNQ